MKKSHLFAFILGIVLVVSTAAVVQQTTGIFIYSTTAKDVPLTVRGPTNQANPFFEIWKGNTLVFNVDSNGLLIGGWQYGVTTNLAILTPGPRTNTLYITNGVVNAVQ